MKNIYDLLFALLRKELCGETFSTDLHSVSAEQYEALYRIANAHDLAHIVGDALYSLNIEVGEETKARFQKKQILAVYRYSQMSYELEQICAAFEKAQIPFMPLKGSVIRKYYEKPEMRTSCDIDIYVKEKDLEKATAVLVNSLGYSLGIKNIYDVSLNSSNGVHIELHFALTEQDERVEKVFENIWEISRTSEGAEYHYLMRNEYFTSYHIYHASKHFTSGGCGIRPFMDLWIAKNKMGYDLDAVKAILEKCNLTSFGDAILHLSDVWFSNAKHTELTREMEEYIIGAGTYGTLENKVAISSQKQGGRFKYLIKRIFMSYSALKRYYPNLDKYPVLYPYYTIVRWFRVLFDKQSKDRAFSELKYNMEVSSARKNKLSDLLMRLDLQ